MANSDKHIRFTDSDKSLASAFARKAASQTHNRHRVSIETPERDIRIGKLGELAFAKYLAQDGKSLTGSEDMFTIWEGIENVDKRDFLTSTGKTVDVKTASRNYHKRILVPYDQFERALKDFYVAVRISENEQEDQMLGYTTKETMAKSGRIKRGKYPAYEVNLRNLIPIGELVKIMPDAPPELLSR